MTRTRLSQLGTPGVPGPNVQVTGYLSWQWLLEQIFFARRRDGEYFRSGTRSGPRAKLGSSSL